MNQERQVWLNGDLIPWEAATVPILSHGFSRASAIFEIFGIHIGPDGPAAFRMDEHLKRLMKSVKLLEMEMAYSQDEIAKAVAEAVKVNGMGRGLVKILAFWGEEAVIKLVLDSKLDLAIFAVPDMPELKLDSKETISVCISKWRKIHPETIPVEAKACSNYLNGYLARKNANKRGFDDAILLGTDGFLAEGPASSVFIIKDGILKTPPLGRILSSITRKSVLEIAPYLKIDISQEALSPDDLFDADEIFLSFTGVKVQAVKRLEDKRIEAPGPVTKRFMDQMDKILDFQDEHFKEWMQQL
jgi:branched-chain amino acid aminotransferase